jgi:hypothetical protein
LGDKKGGESIHQFHPSMEQLLCVCVGGGGGVKERGLEKGEVGGQLLGPGVQFFLGVGGGGRIHLCLSVCFLKDENKMGMKKTHIAICRAKSKTRKYNHF